MEMPDTIRCKWKMNLCDVYEIRVCADDNSHTYHYDRIVVKLREDIKAKDAEIAELKAIVDRNTKLMDYCANQLNAKRAELEAMLEARGFDKI